MKNLTGELGKRILRSRERLSAPEYTYNMFLHANNEWPGDWEGRTILAHICHERLAGKRSAHLKEIISKLPQYINPHGYFGKILEKDIDEQQLSGNNWFLRAMCEYYEDTATKEIYAILQNIKDNLILKLPEKYKSYPINRTMKINIGGVAGSTWEKSGDWILSTDIGCAFILMDGISHLYSITRDIEIKKAFENIADFFMGLDFAGLNMQTHATLSATRGIIRFYQLTNNDKYLTFAKNVFKLYVEKGTTLSYENRNWFCTESWTEPCAITDSIILAMSLYNITENQEYLDFLNKCCANAFRFGQRSSGGAGPNLCLLPSRPFLQAKEDCYEAFFCCTMRICEGFLHLANFAVSVKNQSVYFNILESGTYTLGNHSIDVCSSEPYSGQVDIKLSPKLDIKRLYVRLAAHKDLTVNGTPHTQYLGQYAVIEIGDSNIFSLKYSLLNRSKDLNEGCLYFHGDLLLGVIEDKEIEKQLLKKYPHKLSVDIDGKNMYPLFNFLDIELEDSLLIKQRAYFEKN